MRFTVGIIRCVWIAHIFDSVGAQHEKPVDFRVTGIFEQNSFIELCSLVKVVCAPVVVGAFKELLLVVAAALGQGEGVAAVFAYNDGLVFTEAKRAAAHFTFVSVHSVPLNISQSGFRLMI